jgi:protein-disulfide isomerase
MPLADSLSLSLPVSKRDHVRGPANAPITLVEYGDYQCPYCGIDFYIVRRLQNELQDNLRFVFRNFPLTQIHELAQLSAEVAEAAGVQGKFWEMHDLLFENQQQLDMENILTWAVNLGLDLKKIGTDMELGPVRRRIQEDRRSGLVSGVNGTPTFFINGERYVGPPDYEVMLDAIKDRLEA